jgi:hypothetical protein
VSSTSAKAAVSDAARQGTVLTISPPTPTIDQTTAVALAKYAKMVFKANKLKRECLRAEKAASRPGKKWIRENGKLRRTTGPEAYDDYARRLNAFRRAKRAEEDYAHEVDIQVPPRLSTGEVSALRPGEAWMLDEEARIVSYVTNGTWSGSWGEQLDWEKRVDRWMEEMATDSGTTKEWVRAWAEEEVSIPALYRVSHWRRGVPRLSRVWRTLKNWYPDCPQPNWAS